MEAGTPGPHHGRWSAHRDRQAARRHEAWEQAVRDSVERGVDFDTPRIVLRKNMRRELQRLRSGLKRLHGPEEGERWIELDGFRGDDAVDNYMQFVAWNAEVSASLGQANMDLVCRKAAAAQRRFLPPDGGENATAEIATDQQ